MIPSARERSRQELEVGNVPFARDMVHIVIRQNKMDQRSERMHLSVHWSTTSGPCPVTTLKEIFFGVPNPGELLVHQC